MQYANYKVHLNTISNGELSSYPLNDSVTKGLTLVRLVFLLLWIVGNPGETAMDCG